MRNAFSFAAVQLAALLAFSAASAAPILEITPGTFDFGWCPDNAKVTAQFTVRNSGQDMVPLTAVKPTCGCTASDFQPDGLASNEEKRISLTFNTRGYTNTPFKKLAQIKTDTAENTYSVYVAGHVLKSDNGLVPDSDGIAGFQKDEPRKKTISITNKTTADVTLAVIQAPGAWARAKIPQKPIKPGESAAIEISVEGPLEEERDTSLTLAPSATPDANRVTIAIRTGAAPRPYRVAPPVSSPKPAPVPPAK